MKQAIICIDELTIETLIGIHPWEQNLKQKLIFDLQCFVDTEKASDTDDLSHAVDYEALSQQLSEFISANHFITVLPERPLIRPSHPHDPSRGCNAFRGEFRMSTKSTNGAMQ